MENTLDQALETLFGAGPPTIPEEDEVPEEALPEELMDPEEIPEPDESPVYDFRMLPSRKLFGKPTRPLMMRRRHRSRETGLLMDKHWSDWKKH